MKSFLSWLKWRVRELSRHLTNFPGDDIPIVKAGSALAALEGRDEAIGAKQAIQGIDGARSTAYIPQPERPEVDQPLPDADRGCVLDFRSWYGCYRSC